MEKCKMNMDVKRIEIKIRMRYILSNPSSKVQKKL
jgi:hypothetical protein